MFFMLLYTIRRPFLGSKSRGKKKTENAKTTTNFLILKIKNNKKKIKKFKKKKPYKMK